MISDDIGLDQLQHIINTTDLSGINKEQYDAFKTDFFNARSRVIKQMYIDFEYFFDCRLTAFLLLLTGEAAERFRSSGDLNTYVDSCHPRVEVLYEEYGVTTEQIESFLRDPANTEVIARGSVSMSTIQHFGKLLDDLQRMNLTGRQVSTKIYFNCQYFIVPDSVQQQLVDLIRAHAPEMSFRMITISLKPRRLLEVHVKKTDVFFLGSFAAYFDTEDQDNPPIMSTAVFIKQWLTSSLIIHPVGCSDKWWSSDPKQREIKYQHTASIFAPFCDIVPIHRNLA